VLAAHGADFISVCVPAYFIAIAHRPEHQISRDEDFSQTDKPLLGDIIQAYENALK
jgi:hypothetical protein